MGNKLYILISPCTMNDDDLRRCNMEAVGAGYNGIRRRRGSSQRKAGGH